jgi:hypothetical protein
MSPSIVGYIMKTYSIPSLQELLKEQGYLTIKEKAAQMNILSHSH